MGRFQGVDLSPLFQFSSEEIFFSTEQLYASNVVGTIWRRPFSVSA